MVLLPRTDYEERKEETQAETFIFRDVTFFFGEIFIQMDVFLKKVLTPGTIASRIHPCRLTVQLVTRSTFN